MLLRKLVSEFTGTALLAIIGVGSVPLFYQTQWATFWIALCFGLAVALSILVFGKISGSHINPAVTLTLFIKKEISFSTTLGYVIMQLLGAVLGSRLVIALGYDIGLGCTLPHAGVSTSWILEFLLTFFLMAACLFAGKKGLSNQQSALLIGTVVALEAFFFGPLTGASMNPARSIGPAIASSSNFSHLWIYISAPIAGAISAYFLQHLLQIKHEKRIGPLHRK